MIRRPLLMGALAAAAAMASVAAVDANANANAASSGRRRTTGFLPRRGHRRRDRSPLFAIVRPAPSCEIHISAMRGGHGGEGGGVDDDAGAEYRAEDSAPRQPEKSASAAAAAEVEVEDASSAAAGDDGGAADAVDGKESGGRRASGEGGGSAWDEEIRRTREFYGSPRSSQRSRGAKDILIRGSDAADDLVEEEEEAKTAAVEDERAFGSAQSSGAAESGNAATYDATGGIAEDDGGSEQQGVDGADAHPTALPIETDPDEADADAYPEALPNETNSTEIGSESEDSETTSGNDRLVAGAVVDTPGQDSAGAYTSREVDEEEKATGDISGQDGENASPDDSKNVGDDKIADEAASTKPDVNADEAKEPAADDNGTAEEDSIGSIDGEAPSEADSVAGEDEIADAENVDSVEEIGAPENREGEDGLDTKGQGDADQAVLADTGDARFEGTVENQEVAPISESALDVDDILVPRWQKATTAAASNKLVEEGLRRLHRRDGDEPSVPYVITRAMKRVLVEELGYEPSEVNQMRPDVAVVIIGESLERPDLESLPPRFSNDVEPAMAIEEVREDKSFRGVVASRMQSLRAKFSTCLAGRDPQLTAVVLASLGVVLSLLFGQASDNVTSFEKSTSTEGVPPRIDVKSSIESELSDLEEESDESHDPPSAPEVLPDDLDKSWLDKLISFVTKTFGA